jgi:hypothetical protein
MKKSGFTEEQIAYALDGRVGTQPFEPSAWRSTC